MDLHREEKREEGDRGDQEEKRGNQKEQDRSSQNTDASFPNQETLTSHLSYPTHREQPPQ